MPTRGHQPGVITRQISGCLLYGYTEKIQLYKNEQKNLQVCQLEIGGPIGKEIFIQQTVELCGGSLSGYLRDSLKLSSGEVIAYGRAYYKCSRPYLTLQCFGKWVTRTV